MSLTWIPQEKKMNSVADNLRATLTSKRVWVIIAFFVFYGIEGVRDSLPQWANQLDIVLLLLGGLFGIKPLRSTT
jgi:hypothetical protein